MLGYSGVWHDVHSLSALDYEGLLGHCLCLFSGSPVMTIQVTDGCYHTSYRRPITSANTVSTGRSLVEEVWPHIMFAMTSPVFGVGE